jgi:hypothetical protein
LASAARREVLKNRSGGRRSWKALHLEKIDIALLLYIRVGKDFTVVDVPPLFATL